MADVTGQPGDYTSAIVFGVLTLFCIVVAIAYVSAPSEEGYAVLGGIGALIFGNMSFNRLEKASQRPDPVEAHFIETFVCALKGEREITFVIEIGYESLKPSQSTAMQVNVRILRRLKEYLLNCDELYADPFNTTDRIIQKDIKSLSDELKLRNLSLRTIDVTPGPASTAHRSQGIYFGEHPQ
jgi:hypothetical protein